MNFASWSGVVPTDSNLGNKYHLANFRQPILTRNPPLTGGEVFEIGFVHGGESNAEWQGLLGNQPSPGMTNITTRAGEDVVVHAASVAAILPGFHVAAFAAADPRPARDGIRSEGD